MIETRLQDCWLRLSLSQPCFCAPLALAGAVDSCWLTPATRSEGVQITAWRSPHQPSFFSPRMRKQVIRSLAPRHPFCNKVTQETGVIKGRPLTGEGISVSFSMKQLREVEEPASPPVRESSRCVILSHSHQVRTRLAQPSRCPGWGRWRTPSGSQPAEAQVFCFRSHGPCV